MTTEAYPLVEVNKVLLPPLHIKIGLMINFIKGLDKKRPRIPTYLPQVPRNIHARIKEVVFIGPQIQQLFNDTVIEGAFEEP